MPTAVKQATGVIVESTSSSYLVFEVRSDTGGPKLRIVRYDGGTATVLASESVPSSSAASTWMRVRRAGDNWTASISNDGSTWNTQATAPSPLSVANVGPFVANAPATSGGRASRTVGTIDSFQVLG